MYVTLAGGIATAAVDPILIFGLGLGTDGAAWATVFSRFVFVVVGAHGAIRVHDLVARPVALHVMQDFRPLCAVAIPAVLTNVATPVANGFMTAVIAPFGDDAVAANAVITRLVPVAFGALFALSGAVGPVFGQNLGAKMYDRVKTTLDCGLWFSAGVIALAWIGLWLAQDAIVVAFKAEGETAELVRFFCTIIAGTWAFHGALFVANAAFNNLGAPFLATAFNWGKATIGTVPFAWYGARTGGAEGALTGQGIGAVLFGIAGVVWAYRVIAELPKRSHGGGMAGAGERA
jgi:Na+-driven multidrug efflux pump